MPERAIQEWKPQYKLLDVADGLGAATAGLVATGIASRASRGAIKAVSEPLKGYVPKSSLQSGP